MNLMIDTNIFIDVLTERQPFFTTSKEVLSLCLDKKVQGFLSASSVTDIFYLIYRHFHSNEIADEKLGYILDIVKVLSVTNEDVLNAYVKKSSDFEDCLLATCAISNGCHGIVTRNKKDFESFGITLFSPEEMIALFE